MAGSSWICSTLAGFDAIALKPGRHQGLNGRGLTGAEP